jgi:hypothetical protein
MNPIKMPVTVQGIATLSDDSMRLNLHTQEVNEVDAALLYKFRRQHCEMILTPYGSENEPVTVVDKDLNDKTPSQRLRACLYVLCEKQRMLSNWESFYKEKMEKLIGFVKKEIEKIENPL